MDKQLFVVSNYFEYMSCTHVQIRSTAKPINVPYSISHFPVFLTISSREFYNKHWLYLFIFLTPYVGFTEK